MSDGDVEYVDVVVVGAGISGIDAASHLSSEAPGKSFVVLDSNDGIGGTWWTHRYPGARSDTDLFTYSYGFKPWTGAPIAQRDLILGYLEDAIDEAGFRSRLRLGRRVVSADWSSAENLWTIVTERGESNERETFRTPFLWMCQGYYRHSVPHQPTWEGMAEFGGEIIHPQHWPEDLQMQGKHFAVVGSGATAATLVPALAREGATVTMLQRSPAYFVPFRNTNETADKLRSLGIPDAWIHEICRREALQFSKARMDRALADPETARKALLDGVREQIGDELVEQHFTPRYAPFTQRPIIIPDNDFFNEMKAGRVSIVTDTIDRFNDSGILTTSGQQVDADVIVTATGFEMAMLGDAIVSVDGKPAEFEKTITYLGMMFTGIPNFVWTMSHYNASWTMRADLVSAFAVRLLNHMEQRGHTRVDVVPKEEDLAADRGEWIDTAKWSPGYWVRGLPLMPKTLGKSPWYVSNDIFTDFVELPAVNLDDPEFVYNDPTITGNATLAHATADIGS
ncbi:flavin-containing monooxygenase [Rhodococcus opacus]|jgi:cation diffusion facilitator CzcD-associated flavoprotein CzcO|uniref:flavin-containing monooxygenase n=1 Tax=Rhodococcus opacus TaxID=37919 RepID=UPI0024769A6A|nr:NAD(P)/FAD-dependent oxidoreductase [Rhodococcus opacus]MDH6293261.1 cation diffusion facilitator CzcD-associated flavoprotein CzcO [Rhodococcus opacus]